MSKQTTNVTSMVLAATGTAFGIQDIQSILGIIFTVLSIVVLVINFILRTYDRIKSADKNGDGKVDADEAKDAITKTIADATETAEQINSKINKDGD